MAKESGLGANFYLDGIDLSGDTGSLSNISKGLTPIPQTGIDSYAFERKAGLLSAQMAWSSFFNPETAADDPGISEDHAHVALSGLLRTDRVLSYWHKRMLGVPVASMVAKQVSYNPTRDASGGLLVSVEALSNAWWLDWGLGLTAGKSTITGAANGTGVDFGSPSPATYAFGLQAYLHVFAFEGTSATIALQQSSDNAVGDAYTAVTGGAFTVVTAAPFRQRIATARNQSVERWLRVATTGTFDSITFAVSVTLNRRSLII